MIRGRDHPSLVNASCEDIPQSPRLPLAAARSGNSAAVEGSRDLAQGLRPRGLGFSMRGRPSVVERGNNNGAVFAGLAFGPAYLLHVFYRPQFS